MTGAPPPPLTFGKRSTGRGGGLALDRSRATGGGASGRGVSWTTAGGAGFLAGGGGASTPEELKEKSVSQSAAVRGRRSVKI